MADSSALEGFVVFLAIIVLALARRTVRQLYGTRYSIGRLFGFAGFYVLLFALLAFGTLYAAVGAWGSSADGLIALYVAVPVASAFLAAPYVRRVVRFEQRPDGYWYYRLSWHVPVIYLVLFVARIAAEFAIFGPSTAFASYPPPVPPTTLGLAILVGVDLLFGVSLGLLIGRGIGVYRAHRDIPATEVAQQPSPPLPSG